MESLDILSTLRSQQAGNLGEALPPSDMRKDEICQIIQKFQEWMETAVASFAKQGARSILAVINDSDGTNEKSEGLARLAESYKVDNLDVPDVFTHAQLVRVVRNLGYEDPDIVVNCLDLEATCRLLVESRLLGFNPRIAWFADQNLTGFVQTPRFVGEKVI